VKNNSFLLLYKYTLIHLDYARLMHQYEEKSYSDGDLNHAMGNYFAAKTHKNNS
jgi:hypothetical protein